MTLSTLPRLCTVVILGSTLFLTACGSSSNDDLSFGSSSSTTPPSSSTSAPTSTQAPSDPVDTESLSALFGENGNLWKPAAEEKSSTAGLLVVLLSSEYTGRFDSCEVQRTDGSIEQLDCNDRVPWSHEPFSCVANGGREHWRATIRCDQAAQAKVVCRNFSEEITIQAPGAAVNAVCDRHG